MLIGDRNVFLIEPKPGPSKKDSGKKCLNSIFFGLQQIVKTRDSAENARYHNSSQSFLKKDLTLAAAEEEQATTDSDEDFPGPRPFSAISIG